MRLRIIVLYLCFFVSGAAALVYETVWQRMLTLVFGLQTMSVAAVLAAFLAGLALGARLFGGLADRVRRPGWLYAVVEAGIGMAGWASGYFIEPLLRVFVSIHRGVDPGWLTSNLIRFALAFVALVVPSVLIGATVPIMARLVAQWSGSSSAGFGRFYAVNTLGAVAGAALSGFYLLRELGVQASLQAAIAANGVVVLLALMAGGRAAIKSQSSKFRAERPEARDPAHRRPRRFALLAAALTGALALGYEVAWLRLLAVYTLNSVYVFTMVLTVYLAALSVGTAIATRLLRRSRADSLWLLSAVQALLALFGPLLLAFAPMSARLQVGAAGQTELEIFTIEYLLAVAMVFVPTVLIGMALPLLVDLYAGGVETSGRDVGRVYAWNSIGTILGAATTGALLIPLAGVRGTLLLLCGLNLIIAASAQVIDGTRPQPLARFGRAVVPYAAAVLVLILAICPPVHRFYRPDPDPGETVLYYAEGPSAIVHVSEFERGDQSNSDRYRKLFVDSKAVAGTYDEIVTDQKMLAHLPLLLHPSPQRVLTVGFGTGGTSFSMLQHKVEVHCAEIEPWVPQAFDLFASENALIVGPKHDRHDFRLILDDARSWLHAAPEPYDVIVTDVTSIQYRGNGNLYTTDYFELMKSRLTPEGVTAAWVPATGITPQQLKILVRTFQSVYPHTSVWYMINMATDFVILVGTPQPLAIDLADWSRRMSSTLVARDLVRVGFDNAYKLAACLLLAEGDVAIYAGSGPLHTDDRPILDYLTHASRHQSTLGLNLGEMMAHRSDPFRDLTGWPPNVASGEVAATATRWREASGYLIQGHVRRHAGSEGATRDALELYAKAAALVPEDAFTAKLAAP